MTTNEIIQYALLSAEASAAFAGIVYFRSLKHTYWKYFVGYCVLIFLNELFSWLVLGHFKHYRRYFFDIYGIPIQFLFLFWLYAYKSFQRPKLFYGATLLYLISFLPHLFYDKSYALINSMSYTLGCLIVLVFGVMEFNRLLKSEEIIRFHQNKMFYINLGVLLFYVGTMPFFAFIQQLYEYDITIYTTYKTITLTTTFLLYFLYTASFIWGKSKPSSL